MELDIAKKTEYFLQASVREKEKEQMAERRRAANGRHQRSQKPANIGQVMLQAMVDMTTLTKKKQLVKET
eukprot:12896886-Prorocentrum_lima.AAC.1